MSDLLKVRECEAELLEPREFSREDFIKFVSSLALSVHVEASLKSVVVPTSVAILVSNFRYQAQHDIMVGPLHVCVSWKPEAAEAGYLRPGGRQCQDCPRTSVIMNNP